LLTTFYKQSDPITENIECQELAEKNWNLKRGKSLLHTIYYIRSGQRMNITSFYTRSCVNGTEMPAESELKIHYNKNPGKKVKIKYENWQIFRNFNRIYSTVVAPTWNAIPRRSTSSIFFLRKAFHYLLNFFPLAIFLKFESWIFID
jgi:hypothetical protein